MNFASALMSREEFKNWFAAIDQDGSSALSLNELIPALADFFKVYIPQENSQKKNPFDFLVANKKKLNDSEIVREVLKSDKKTLALVN